MSKEIFEFIFLAIAAYGMMFWFFVVMAMVGLIDADSLELAVCKFYFMCEG